MKRIVVGIVGLTLIALPGVADAAMLFSDGFESGTFGAWSASAGLVIEAGDAYGGILAAGNNGTSNAWARATWSTGQADLYARVFVKVYSSSTMVRLLRFRTASGGPISRIYLNGSRRLAIRNDAAGTNRVSSITVSTGAWHELEFRSSIAGANGAVEVWYDGTRVASLSGTQNLGTTAIRQLELGNPVAGSVYDLEFDDVAIAQERIGGTPPPPPPTGLTVVAAGDICANSSSSLAKCTQTGDRVVAEDPDRVLVLGDIAYPSGTTTDFARYDPRWGSGNIPSFYAITRPIPGNHEYDDPAIGNGAEGYRAYFPDDVAPASGPLYYSWTEGGWHFVGLDTDVCSAGEGCPGIGSGSAQLAFLRADLAADTQTCDLAFGHHPRWSSPAGTGATSRHGSQASMQAAWQILVDEGVDLYLAGHDHDYERFAAMDAGGSVSTNGTRQFVVGTGGAGLYPFASAVLSTSEVRIVDHGILILTLSPTTYSWRFTDEFGVTLDAGGPVPCH